MVAGDRQSEEPATNIILTSSAEKPADTETPRMDDSSEARSAKLLDSLSIQERLQLLRGIEQV
jgi:hypothetical protein